MNGKINIILLIMGQVLSMRREGRVLNRGIDRLKNDQKGFGMNELLGIAAALIIAAFVIIPSLRTFATTLMTGLSKWWTDTVATKIFPT
jgi:hypothetical protein